MENIVNISNKDNPVLLDKVLQDIINILTSRLEWLDYAFGKSYRMSNGDKTSICPMAYNNKGEYISLLPNDRYGNFSWFDIYDPQEIDTRIIRKPILKFKGALIFWYNIETIYENNGPLYTEEIKKEILDLLTTPGIIKSVGQFTITELYERPENIYKGYNLENIDTTCLVYPYIGLRIEFTIKTRELC